MKHPEEQDDTTYGTDETKLILCDCVHEVLMVNPLDEYLKKVDYGDEEQIPKEKPQEKPLEKYVVLLSARKKAKSKGGR